MACLFWRLITAGRTSDVLRFSRRVTTAPWLSYNLELAAIFPGFGAPLQDYPYVRLPRSFTSVSNVSRAIG